MRKKTHKQQLSTDALLKTSKKKDAWEGFGWGRYECDSKDHVHDHDEGQGRFLASKIAE